MDRAKFLMLTVLAVVCTGFLTLSEPADARLIDLAPHGGSALAAIHLSDDVMALAGFAVLVCSNHPACGQ